MTLFDFILRFVPPAGRRAALAAPAEIEVAIGRNAFGGWSIFAANAAARRLLGGPEPTGNFGTYAQAHARAVDHNCWTVVEPAALPGVNSVRCAA